MSHKIKKIIFSITGVLILICMYISLNKVENQSQPATARIDISEKTTNSQPCFIIKNLADGELFTPTGWMAKNGLQGYVVQKEAMSQELEITATSDKCKINFALRGPWELKDKKNKSKGIKELWVEYTKFSINGQNIITKPTQAWHNKQFYHSITAQKGNIFYVQAKWRKLIVPLSTAEKFILGITYLALLFSLYCLNFTTKKQLALSITFSSLCILGSFPYIKEQGIRFDFYGFIILATFIFFVMYKIIKYLSRFKIEEHHSRIDIVFLATFFALLFVPMLHISDAEKSTQENRMLAKYKPIFKDNKFNLNFGRDFDAWFSDRFWGREKIIKLVSNLTYNLSSIYSNKKAVYLKENGWMFNFPLVDNPVSDSKIKEINRTIVKLDKFLEDKGIKFYILLVPQKESIYQNELLDYGYDFQKDEKFQRKIHQIIDANTKNQIIYPYQELMEAKQQDYVFFKQVHHWTDWGAYQGYQSLMARIKSDFPDINIVSLDEYKQSTSTKIRDDWDRAFNVGHTTNSLNLKKRANEILTTEYKYYDKKKQTVTEKREQYVKEFFNEQGKYKIFLTGNSQNEDLLQFLPYSAKELRYLRLNRRQVPTKEEFKFMKYYKKELLEFKPDIVILSMSVNWMRRITDFYKD